MTFCGGNEIHTLLDDKSVSENEVDVIPELFISFSLENFFSPFSSNIKV